MYVKDVDYCRQVRELGYSIEYLPKMEVIHYESGSKPWIGEKALLPTMRSYVIYLKKFHSVFAAFAVRYHLGFLRLFRSAVYFLKNALNKSSITTEKIHRYYKAGRYEKPWKVSWQKCSKIDTSKIYLGIKVEIT